MRFLLRRVTISITTAKTLRYDVTENGKRMIRDPGCVCVLVQMLLGSFSDRGSEIPHLQQICPGGVYRKQCSHTCTQSLPCSSLPPPPALIFIFSSFFLFLSSSCLFHLSVSRQVKRSLARYNTAWMVTLSELEVQFSN